MIFGIGRGSELKHLFSDILFIPLHWHPELGKSHVKERLRQADIKLSGD